MCAWMDGSPERFVLFSTSMQPLGHQLLEPNRRAASRARAPDRLRVEDVRDGALVGWWGGWIASAKQRFLFSWGRPN